MLQPKTGWHGRPAQPQLSSGRSRRPCTCLAEARASSSPVPTGARPPVALPAPNPQPRRQPALAADPELIHGRLRRADGFAWLRDPTRRDPAVRQLLQQEELYGKIQLRHLAPLRKKIEQELAEAAWRQAFALAAQQPYGSTASEYGNHWQQIPYGSYNYRREAVSTAPGRLRHLRLPLVPSPPLPSPAASASAAAAAAAGPSAPIVVLDEAVCAAASSAPASYALHSFAPSPSFNLAAVTEAAEPEPLGERRPDRFTLTVLDAASGAAVAPPLPGCSGDVGWVMSGPVSSGGGTGSGGGPGGVREERVYFTRAAQRELWCWDPPVPPPGVSLGLSSGAEGGAQSEPKLAFRDPDGVTIQIVDHGGQLYAEAVGDNAVPLEIRWLGRCRAPGRMGGGSDATAALGVGGGGDGGAAVGAGAVAGEAGEPLLPRWPGRCYSALHLPLGPAATTAAATISTTAPAASGPHVDLESALLIWIRDLECPNGRLVLAAHVTGPPGDGWACQENGGRDEGGKGYEQGSAQASAQGVRTEAPFGPSLRPSTHKGLALLELLPQHPSRRLVAVRVAAPPSRQQSTLVNGTADVSGADTAESADGGGGSGGARVLAMSAELDERGDVTGRYELTEYCADVPAVRQALVRQLPYGSSAPIGAGADGIAGAGVTAEAEAVQGLVAAVRRRCVELTGPQRHGEVQLLAWGAATARTQGDADVTPGDVSNDVADDEVVLSYSSMTAPAATARVRLLPVAAAAVRGGDTGPARPPAAEHRRGSAGADGGMQLEAEHGGRSGVSAGADAGVVQLVCGDPSTGVVTERLWAASHDGVLVPVTLCRPAHKTGAAGGTSGPMPLLLRVYGAYGRDPPIGHQPSLAPLLQRGVAVAVAHVRGGGWLGPAWYEAGRGRRKANGGLDALAAARALVAAGVTAPRMLAAEAASAGAWVLGPALNSAGSSLFAAAVLTVPSLDVLNSCLEDPLYASYDLGAVRSDMNLYDSMCSWAPYDRLYEAGSPGAKTHAYPALLVRTGLYDTSVPYWEPLKFVAKLRCVEAARQAAAAKAGRAAGPQLPLRVLQVAPGDHHSFEAPPEDALRAAFLLWALGVWRPAT